MSDRRDNRTDDRDFRRPADSRPDASSDSSTGRDPAGGSLRKNTYSVRRSTKRVAAKYRAHEVDQLEPSSTSSESTRQQYRRETHNDYFEMSKRKTSRIRALIIAAIGVVALVVAGVAARTVFVASFESSLKNGIESPLYERLDSLTRADGDPITYTLLVGLDDGGTGGEYVADVVMVLRLDTQERTAGIILIPDNTRAYVDGQGYVGLSDVRAYGGQELMYESVSEMLGVQIDHYAEADIAQFNGLVDVLGGIDVVVPPNTSYGGLAVEEGQHTIHSQDATVMSRCWQSYSQGLEQRNQNNVDLFKALLVGLSQASIFKTLPIMNQLGDCVASDLTYAEYAQLRSILEPSLIFGGVLPHTIGTLSGASYSFVDAEDIADFMERVESLGSSVLAEEETVLSTAFDPSAWSVTVRNGSGVSGTASQAAERLAAASFTVVETGNANQFVYDETLVVYENDADITAAENVIAALGCGRAVQNPGSYEYDGEILVVVGKDWVP